MKDAASSSSTYTKHICDTVQISHWPTSIWNEICPTNDIFAKMLDADLAHHQVRIFKRNNGDFILRTTRRVSNGDLIAHVYGLVTYESYANRQVFDKKRVRVGTKSINATLENHLKLHIHIPHSKKSRKMNSKYAAAFCTAVTPYTFSCGAWMKIVRPGDETEHNCTVKVKEINRVKEVLDYKIIQILRHAIWRSLRKSRSLLPYDIYGTNISPS